MRARALPLRPRQRPLAPQRRVRRMGRGRPPARARAPRRAPRSGRRPQAGSTRRSSPPSSPPATTAASSSSQSGPPAPRSAGRPEPRSSSTRPGRARIERGAARRPRRDRQGLLGRPRARGDARAPGPRCRGGARRPRRRHRRLRLPARPRALADRDRRPPQRRRPRSASLQLEQGGVATSGRDARRFGPARSLHHLIDPATGAPASHGPLAVTVVAPDPAEAEAHATALAISSLAEAASHLAEHPELGALFVAATGAAPRSGRCRSSRASGSPELRDERLPRTRTRRLVRRPRRRPRRLRPPHALRLARARR